MNDAKPNLILIGLRASGKSTLGALLAESLEVGFVDLDDVTSELMGCDGAGSAIQTQGLDAFREAEARALRSVLEESGCVIALGGGSPTAPGCRELLSEDPCRVMYLRALPATLRERLKTADNTDRPTLVGNDVVDEVQTLFDQRDEKYRELSETVIHTDGVSLESVMATLLAVARAGV